MDYKITNIKLSVKCSNVSLDSVFLFCKVNEIPYKKYNNFVVIKSVFTYIIFKKNNKEKNTKEYHTNITKIPTFCEVPESIQYLKTLLPNILLLSYKIDNISVSCNLLQTVDIFHIQKVAQNDCFVTYNKETFPGLFLKFKAGCGTAIVFYTGKCVLLGSKNIQHIEKIVSSLHRFIQK